MGVEMNEFRCGDCNGIKFSIVFEQGSVEATCDSCGDVYEIHPEYSMLKRRQQRKFPTEMDEVPFQTFERIFGIKWPGGRSKCIRFLLYMLNDISDPGSADANLKLQYRLNVIEKERTSK